MTDVIALSELSDEPGRPYEIAGRVEYGEFSPRLLAVLESMTENVVRIENALQSAQIMTLAQLCSKTRAELRKTKNLGRKYVDGIEKALARFGLSLADGDPPVLVRDGATVAEAQVQRLQRWIGERLCAVDPPVEIGEEIERDVLVDVMLILDGRSPTNKRLYEPRMPCGDRGCERYRGHNGPHRRHVGTEKVSEWP